MPSHVWALLVSVWLVATFWALLVSIWLGATFAAPAHASGCPNAALRVGQSEHLPDCRAYEQVSPVEKDGGDAVTVTPLFPAQSSPCESGGACAIAYMNATNAFAGAQGNEVPNAYVATRGANGWQNTSVAPPSSQQPPNGLNGITYAFSPDLSRVVVRVALARLTDNAPAGVYNLYLREADGAYSLVTANPPAQAPEAGCGGCFATQDVPAFAGASADFRHVVFEANDSLLAGAPGEGVDNLYEAVDEQVRLVGILPDGAVPSEGAMAGAEIDPTEEPAGQLEHAISQDGSRVLFRARADGGEPDSQQAGDVELYDRIDGGETVEPSAPAPGAQPSRCETAGGVCTPGSARFWAASDDGSLVFFTSKAALTTTSYTGAEAAGVEDPGDDLYLYDLDTRELTDLTPDAGSAADPNGAGVLGVVGSSQDGSYVYFVAEGKLTGAEGPVRGEPNPVSGQPNLYVWHRTGQDTGTLSFVATLEAGSEHSGDVLDWSEHPSRSQAYVTPDGKHLAFMSVRPLTGYDNEDQDSEASHGVLDHEVFEYSAETAQLVCASCDPSGERPLGSAFIGAKLGERVSTPFHQPRSLSDDGSRLFFSSSDPLVPGVAGANVKVFEYDNGSVALISGLGDGSDDVFLDASASGDDVFFATREQLVPGDEDELEDVYDARVDGGIPAPAPPAPQCVDGACQGTAISSASFSLPLSGTFTGPGNLVAPAPRAKPKPTRKQLLARALAKCRKVANRRRRATCERTARRRYGPKHGGSAHTRSPRRAGSTRR